MLHYASVKPLQPLGVQASIFHACPNNNNNNNHFTALCPALLGWAGTRRNTPTYHPDHYPISFFHLPQSIASSLFKLRGWQSFCTTSLYVLFGLPLCLEPSTSYSTHFFTQSVSSFRRTCPYHCNLFCCIINIISSIPSLSLNSLLETLSSTLTLHIYMTQFRINWQDCSRKGIWRKNGSDGGGCWLARMEWAHACSKWQSINHVALYGAVTITVSPFCFTSGAIFLSELCFFS